MTSGGAPETTRCGRYEVSGIPEFIMLSLKVAGIVKIGFDLLPGKRLYVFPTNVLDFCSMHPTLRRQASILRTAELNLKTDVYTSDALSSPIFRLMG